MHTPLNNRLLRPIAQAIRGIPPAAYASRPEPGLEPADTPPGCARADAESVVRRRPLRRLSDDESVEQLMRDRLVIARKLNSLDQKEAADKLGYKNSSQLSKVESGEAPLPKSLLRKASLAYGVSCDWLLGLSNEPERDAREAHVMGVMRAVHESVRKNAERVAVEMLALANDQLPLEAQLRKLLTAGRAATQSFENVCRHNATFNDDIRGGAMLQNDIDSLIEVTVEIGRYLDRRASLEQARLGRVEIDYELENESDEL